MDVPPRCFIDRHYDDPPFPADQPWPRSRRSSPEEPEWEASVDPGGHPTSIDEFQMAEFESVDEAIVWARQRARFVLVRLGTTEDTYYSAGEMKATTRIDGKGMPYLTWPPDRWPKYEGPQAETRRFARR